MITMSMTPSATPVTPTWVPAEPYVTAGIAFLGEVLVARGLCEANPASNAGASFHHAQFVLEPSRFAVRDLEVRWSRHVGASGVQNRPCSRSEWTFLLGFIRLALQDVSA